MTSNQSNISSNLQMENFGQKQTGWWLSQQLPRHLRSFHHIVERVMARWQIIQRSPGSNHALQLYCIAIAFFNPTAFANYFCRVGLGFAKKMRRDDGKKTKDAQRIRIS